MGELLKRLAALALLTAATACTHTPPAYVSPIDGAGTVTAPAGEPTGSPLGPLATALQSEIASALQATAWPDLNPSMEAVIAGPPAAPEVEDCGSPDTTPGDDCTWGSADAATKVVLVGDSIGLSYANPFRLIAEHSGGRIQVHAETLAGCQFADDLIDNPDDSVMAACPSRKQHAIDYINTTKPSVVVASNSYGEKKVGGTKLSQKDWADSVQRILAKLQPSGARIVMLSAPPADVKISDCYGKRSSTPPSCVSKVTDQWSAMANTEQGIAGAVAGLWVDSRPWFCGSRPLCPAFVGTTPTKFDAAHMSPAYGEKIAPVIAESFTAAGVPLA